MNEILKFKQDRKVIKADGGASLSYNEDYDDLMASAGNVATAKKPLPTKFRSNGRIYWRNGNEYWDITRGTKTGQTFKVLNPDFNWILDALGNWRNLRKGDPLKRGRYVVDKDGSKYWLGSDGSKTLVLKGGTPASTTGGTPGATAQRRVGTDWNKQYQDFLGKMTDDQKAWFAQRGIDYSSAQQMQTYLANHGQDLGKWGADGRWGNTSQAAWDNFVATTMKNNPLQTPVRDIPQPAAEPVVDASDPFGYESKGNYALDNAKTLKTNGIRDWTTMLNYIKGNQDSAFSQDMMHRFGSDLSKWKLEDVEGTMGVSGHYGSKDRSRIQGFMAGNQTTWNNQRQAAINNYAKKTFLPNPSGANTLGRQPGLSKEWAGTDGTA